MVEKLGELGSDPVEVSPDRWEMEFDFRRKKEIAMFLDYAKGDEDGVLLSFFCKDNGISEEWFTVAVARAGAPVTMVPYIVELTEDQNPRIALPLGCRDKHLKIRADFINSSGAPGTLKIGARYNEFN